MKTGVWIMVSLVLSACSAGDPTVPPAYRDIVVPTEQLASKDARARGRLLFEQSCVLCHGVNADGKGVRYHYLSNPPANFKSKAWRRRTTPRRAYFVLREGVSGTSMPAWPSFSEDQTWDLVSYVLSVYEGGS